MGSVPDNSHSIILKDGLKLGWWVIGTFIDDFFGTAEIEGLYTSDLRRTLKKFKKNSKFVNENMAKRGKYRAVSRRKEYLGDTGYWKDGTLKSAAGKSKNSSLRRCKTRNTVHG